MIDLNEWHGFTRKAQPDGSFLVWNKSKQRYDIHGDKPGIRFTYFSAQGFYVAKGKAAPEPNFYSNVHLGKRLWKEKERDSVDYLGRRHGGHVPLETLLDRLSDVLGVDDFETTYQNWSYRYEIGIRYIIDGEQKTYLWPGMPIQKKKGKA